MGGYGFSVVEYFEGWVGLFFGGWFEIPRRFALAGWQLRLWGYWLFNDRSGQSGVKIAG